MAKQTKRHTNHFLRHVGLKKKHQIQGHRMQRIKKPLENRKKRHTIKSLVARAPRHRSQEAAIKVERKQNGIDARPSWTDGRNRERRTQASTNEPTVLLAEK